MSVPQQFMRFYVLSIVRKEGGGYMKASYSGNSRGEFIVIRFWKSAIVIPALMSSTPHERLRVSPSIAEQWYKPTLLV